MATPPPHRIPYSAETPNVVLPPFPYGAPDSAGAESRHNLHEPLLSAEEEGLLTGSAQYDDDGSLFRHSKRAAFKLKYFGTVRRRWTAGLGLMLALILAALVLWGFRAEGRDHRKFTVGMKGQATTTETAGVPQLRRNWSAEERLLANYTWGYQEPHDTLKRLIYQLSPTELGTREWLLYTRTISGRGVGVGIGSSDPPEPMRPGRAFPHKGLLGAEEGPGTFQSGSYSNIAAGMASVGDYAMDPTKPHEAITIEQHRSWFHCAEQVVETYSEPGQRVIYYLVSDSAELKEAAVREMPGKVVVSGIKPTWPGVREKTIQEKLDGEHGVLAEMATLGKTDFQILTMMSGLGKIPVWTKGLTHRTIRIPPLRDTTFKVPDCTSETALDSFEDLAAHWSLG
ncbi:hypothetical protein P7C70_g7525, partial [Phenoliferia sp. Uapishka_3]